MNIESEQIDFDILGYSLRLKRDENDTSVGPDKVVNLVNEKTSEILDQNPGLDKGQVAVLAALKIAEDYLNVLDEYQDQVGIMQSKAINALQFIEEVSPTTV